MSLNEEDKLKLARAITDQLPAPDEIRDDWGKMIIDTVLPEGVWSREGLSQRDRSFITVAALTVLYRPNELRLHIGRALHIYGGFPTSVEGMHIATEVFAEHDKKKEAKEKA